MYVYLEARGGGGGVKMYSIKFEKNQHSKSYVLTEILLKYIQSFLHPNRKNAINYFKFPFNQLFNFCRFCST